MKITTKQLRQIIKEEIGKATPKTATEVAQYCWDNYTKITGYPDADKFEEGHFPGEIEEYVENSGVDWDAFQEAWGDLLDDNDPVNDRGGY